jgi:hypothetical protein
MDATSLRLVGDFGFVLLRGSSQSSQLGFSTELTAVRVEVEQRGRVSIYGQRTGDCYRPGSMQWLTIQTVIELVELTVECSNTQIQLESLRFSSHAQLSVLGEQNFLSFSNCSLERLELRSERPNNLDFRKQSALTELRATLHGSHLEARRSGANWSAVCGYDGSNVFLYIEPQFHSRTFDFTKDSKSQILVETDNEPQRIVTADHEQWDIERNLKSIKIERQNCAVSYGVQEAPQEQPSGTPSCVVCQNALPSYVVQPCTHMCLCSECAPLYRAHNLANCPICRTPIQELTHVFLACL